MPIFSFTKNAIKRKQTVYSSGFENSIKIIQKIRSIEIWYFHLLLRSSEIVLKNFLPWRGLNFSLFYVENHDREWNQSRQQWKMVYHRILFLQFYFLHIFLVMPVNVLLISLSSQIQIEYRYSFELYQLQI